MKSICLIFFVLFGFPVFAQSPSYYSLDSEDGLPNDVVWCTIQDTLGYMWIGTGNGLARYDGSNFITYKREEGLWGNSIIGLTEADNGNIAAISFDKGINKIHIGHYPEIEQIGKPQYFLANSFLIGDSVFTVSYSGVSYFDGNELIRYSDNSIFKKSSSRMIKKGPNRFWVLSDIGLTEVNPNGNLPILHTKKKSGFFSIFESDTSNCWIGGVGAVFHLKDRTLIDTIALGLPKEKSVNYVLLSKENTLYASVVDEGIFSKKPSDESFKFIGDQLELGKTIANHIYEDNLGNIWFSTWGKGLKVLRKSLFTSFRTSIDLPFNTIQAIHFDEINNFLLIGAMKDMYVLENEKFAPLNLPQTKGGMVNSGIILSNKIGDIVINSLEPNLTSLFKFTKLKRKGIDLFSGWISNQTLLSDDSSKIFVTGIFKEGDTKYLKVNEVPLKEGFNEHTTIFKAESDLRIAARASLNVNDSCFWLSTFNGPVVIDLKRDSVYRTCTEQPCFFPLELQGSKVYSYVEDLEDGIWLSTDLGVYHYNSSWEKLKLPQEYEGETIKDLAVDSQGSLWAATSKGLLNYYNNSFFRFSLGEGLIDNSLSRVEIDKNKDVIYTGNSGGLSISKIENLRNASIASDFPFHLISVFLNDSVPLPLDNIVYETDDLSLSFNIFTSSYNSPNEIEVNYKLDDRNWILLENNNLVLKNLFNYSFGDHQIKFRAKKGPGKWIEKGSVEFTFKPPFYKETWFQILALLLVIISILALSYYQIQQNKTKATQKLDLEKKMNFLEQRALSASMNPHFLFNALNSIQDFINQNRLKELDFYLSRFAKLIRSNLEASGKDRVLLSDELERLELYLDLEELRFDSEFSWSINIDSEIDTEFIIIPSMMIQPFVENSIWHGIRPIGEGMVTVSIFETSGELSIKVQDNGQGIEKALKSKRNGHKSLGIRITEERVHLFGSEQNFKASVSYKSSDKGTLVSIILPLVEPN